MAKRRRRVVGAMTLAVGSFDLRYALGQYYKKADLRRRAILQFQHVVEAQPGHRAAKRALTTLLAQEAGGA